MTYEDHIKNIEETSENLIKDYIEILEDVGLIPSEVRKDAIQCSLLCINKQLRLIGPEAFLDYVELVQMQKYLEEL